MTTAPVDWYAARAGGVVAYLLLTLVVVVGMLLSTRTRFRLFPAFALEDVHRFAGLLAGTFIGVHVLTIALDAVVPFSLGQLVVPFTASFRPFWTGLGVVAVELLLALGVTNRLRSRLPLPRLAAGALPQLRGLGRGDAAHGRRRHRPRHDLARRARGRLHPRRRLGALVPARAGGQRDPRSSASRPNMIPSTQSPWRRYACRLTPSRTKPTRSAWRIARSLKP